MRMLFLSWLCMLGATTLLQAQTPAPPQPGSGEEKNKEQSAAPASNAGVSMPPITAPVKVVPHTTRKPKPARVEAGGNSGSDAAARPASARSAKGANSGKSARAPRVGARSGMPAGPKNSNAGTRRRNK